MDLRGNDLDSERAGKLRIICEDISVFRVFQGYSEFDMVLDRKSVV